MAWFENLPTADLYILIAGCVAYVLIVWIPILISWYLVINRPNDKRSEKEFDGKWYKWKKQYMWHELWYRTHIILLVSLIVVFIFEDGPEKDGWPVWAPIVFLLVTLTVGICLRFISKKVNNRVPSEDEKKKLYSMVTGTMRSNSDAQKLLQSIANDQEQAGAQPVGSNSNLQSTETDGETKTGDLESKVNKEIELQKTKGTDDAGENDKHHD